MRNRKKLTRRNVVIGGGLVGCCALTAAIPGGYVILRNTIPGLNDRSNIGDVDLQTSLHIPPLLEAERTPTGLSFLEMALETGEIELLPGKLANTWGVNGGYLGPTIRMIRGQDVQFRVTNHFAGRHVDSLAWDAFAGEDGWWATPNDCAR